MARTSSQRVRRADLGATRPQATSLALTKGTILMNVVSDDRTARNATIDDLVALLCGQQARKVDVAACASSIRAEGGCLVLDGTTPVLGIDEVTMTAGRYRPTDVCDARIADKLGIPRHSPARL